MNRVAALLAPCETTARACLAERQDTFRRLLRLEAALVADDVSPELKAPRGSPVAVPRISRARDLGSGADSPHGQKNGLPGGYARPHLPPFAQCRRVSFHHWSTVR